MWYDNITGKINTVQLAELIKIVFKSGFFTRGLQRLYANFKTESWYFHLAYFRNFQTSRLNTDFKQKITILMIIL